MKQTEEMGTHVFEASHQIKFKHHSKYLLSIIINN